MAEVTFNDRGQCIIKSGKGNLIRFQGYPIELKDIELYNLIQVVARVQDVLKDEWKERKRYGDVRAKKK
jgi:hypothetical protein